ncbi:tetratricopeptide repeat protein [Flagellimonas meishanensis]|uniref:tetratricopeptide repeat protein n=1 Tax=Flagellimonas meishanensis TaxID=2873264 RepID=UPI001CA793E1|nr:tetratricopeptide repeat protein [[Muricauda] meishanensis]
MSLSFQEQIENANVLLQENQLEKSIESYLEALRLASSPQQKVHLHSVLGRLYQKTKNPKGALSQFKSALEQAAQFAEAMDSADRASILNNMAAIYAEMDHRKAIDHYKEAIHLYQGLVGNGNKGFLPHLANTLFAKAEAHNKKNDFYFAKKNYKEAITVYESLSNIAYERLRASAHHQLGNIYTEEFNLFDAKVHYGKALTLFNNLIGAGEDALKPYLAAALNNLGVTFKSMGEPEKALEQYNKALDVYHGLSDKSPEIFEPYVAATFNSLGILYAEVGNFERAVEHIQQAVVIYNGLADIKPREYTHYLATGLHNLGLFHFELKEYELAGDYLSQALEIRKKLAMEQPKNFDADFCATALNLVELYQTEMERKLDFDYKEKALALLNDVQVRLERYDAESSVIKNMKSDCGHYLDYFEGIDTEQVTVNVIMKRVNDLYEEIDGTILPAEKLVFQQEITALLNTNSEHFPNSTRLRNELVNAHTNQSWLYLRLKEFNKAERTVLEVPKQERQSLALQCNLAHGYLLQDQMDQALEIYCGLKEQTNAVNEKFMDIVLKDFEILQRDGIDHKGFEVVKKLLSVT